MEATMHEFDILLSQKEELEGCYTKVIPRAYVLNLA
jgi:hypothetical protein